MTFREIQAALDEISDREKLDYASRAALQGIKVAVVTKEEMRQRLEEEVDSETKSKTEKLMQEALERRKREGR